MVQTIPELIASQACSSNNQDQFRIHAQGPTKLYFVGIGIYKSEIHSFGCDDALIKKQAWEAISSGIV